MSFNRIFSFSLVALSLLASCSRTPQQPASTTDAQPEPSKQPSDLTLYQAAGDAITQHAQAALMSQVMAQIKAGGPIQALDYCYVNASALTDSLQRAQQEPVPALLRRASARNRNPANRATSDEACILSRWQASWQGRAPEPVIQQRGDTVHYYKAIPLLAEGCLTCHGPAIEPSLLAAIQARYPNDRATGYALNDLRGMWHVAWVK